jgi:hypothetical protein
MDRASQIPKDSQEPMFHQYGVEGEEVVVGVEEIVEGKG